MVCLVLTMIAGRDGEAALGDCAAAVSAALPGNPAPDWLAPGIACDLALGDIDFAATEAAARQAIGDAAIDVIVQPTANRRKRLLVADMESTIIEDEMLDELADFVGLRDRVADITRRAMNGELDFEAALAARVALLKGLSASVLDEAASRIRLMPGARALVATMRAAGARTALVSGGFTVFAERIATELGFDHVKANRLEIEDGRVAGTVAAPVLTRETKLEVLIALAGQHGVALSQT